MKLEGLKLEFTAQSGRSVCIPCNFHLRTRTYRVASCAMMSLFVKIGEGRMRAAQLARLVNIRLDQVIHRRAMDAC